MSELDIEIRYGFISRENTEILPTPPAKSGISVRVFEEDEDNQWRNGILVKRSRGIERTRGRIAIGIAMDELDSQVIQAREEGKVPLRVAGPAKKLPDFIAKTGLKSANLMF